MPSFGMTNEDLRFRNLSWLIGLLFSLTVWAGLYRLVWWAWG